MTRLRAENHISVPSRSKRRPESLWALSSLPLNEYRMPFSPGIRQRGREANHSPSSNVKFKTSGFIPHKPSWCTRCQFYLTLRIKLERNLSHSEPRWVSIVTRLRAVRRGIRDSIPAGADSFVHSRVCEISWIHAAFYPTGTGTILLGSPFDRVWTLQLPNCLLRPLPHALSRHVIEAQNQIAL